MAQPEQNRQAGRRVSAQGPGTATTGLALCLHPWAQLPWTPCRRAPGYIESKLRLRLQALVFTGIPVGSASLQGLENCLREIPVPRSQSAWAWSLAGDREPRRMEPKNWMADKEGKAWLAQGSGSRKRCPILTPGCCHPQPPVGPHPPRRCKQTDSECTRIL